MKQAVSDLARLSPAALERRVQEHLGGMFAELDAVRASFSPLRTVREHPLLTAAAVGALGAAVGYPLARAFRRKRASAAAPVAARPPAPGFRAMFATALGSALGSATGNLLAGTIQAILDRRAQRAAPPPSP